MSNPDIQAELLRSEYPFLRPDQDPDIERYFEYRAAGRPNEALALYRSHLVPRYPDEDIRTRLLRAYRLRSPAYRFLLGSAYALLGNRLLERTKRIIKYIAIRAGSYDPTDAYSTIKAAESILAMLPKERFEAVAALERLSRYARRLDYFVLPLSSAEALVRAYVTEALSVVEDERQRKQTRKRQAWEEERRRLVERDKADLEEARRRMSSPVAEVTVPRRRPPQSRAAAAAPIIDLSSLRFSAADISRIQIPPTLVKVEDQTLAYSFKYWPLMGDASFERVLFLYSRKYRTKHYEVFTAICRGRLSAKRDDEILSSVMGLLTTGYYYSIRGDIYLQRNWARLKAKLEKPPVPQGDQVVHPPTLRRKIAGTAVSMPAPAPVEAMAVALTPRTAVNGEGGRTGGVGERRPESATRLPSGPEDSRPRVSPQSGRSAAGGSVSDKLRRLSGRSYDVYRDLFLARSRPAVRKVLSRDRGLFHTVPVEAENIVYDFLRDHYTDPYMDWAGSEARSNLASLGYFLESIDQVIAECYRGMGR